MASKLNIGRIITDHFRTLRNLENGRPNWGEVAGFFVFPALLAIMLVLVGFSVNDGTVSILVTSLSIFAALLLNLLLLTFDVLRKTDDNNVSNTALTPTVTRFTTVRRQLLKETYSNISYCIFVSLTCVLVLLGFAVWDLGYYSEFWRIVRAIASGVVYFLVVNFVLSLFMVLKRVHLLMAKEFV